MVWGGEGLCGSEKWCDVAKEAKIPVLLSYCLNSTCVLQGHIHHTSGKKTLQKALYVMSNGLVLVEVTEVQVQALVRLEARLYSKGL